MKGFRLFVFILQLTGWALWLALPYLVRQPDVPQFFPPFHIKHFSEHLMYMAFYYVNIYYFIPVLFPKRGLPVYLVVLFLIMLLMLCMNNLVEYWLFGEKMMHYPFSLASLVPIMAVIILSSSVGMFRNWLMEREEKQQLREEKIRAEMALLRLQMSPHFLFNSLNNIAALVRFSPEQAEQSIHQLSDLMRYSVRTTNVNAVPLEEEIEFLSGYIALQKLRLPASLRFETNLHVYQGKLQIEPLLLIGFFENAFKHGITGDADDFIRLDLEVRGNILLLATANQTGDASCSRDKISGVGLENIRKRLQLVYPKQHELRIENEGKIFRAQLQIELHDA